MHAGLRAHNLVIGYDEPLATALSFGVGPGEILVVVGESGCGKSTLLSTLAGVTAPLGGEIFLGERNLRGVPIHQRNIGLVFQDPLLFPHLSLIDNIGYSLRASGQSRDTARARATELLEWVGLSEISGQKTWNFPAGKRVGLRWRARLQLNLRFCCLMNRTVHLIHRRVYACSLMSKIW